MFKNMPGKMVTIILLLLICSGIMQAPREIFCIRLKYVSIDQKFMLTFTLDSLHTDGLIQPDLDNFQVLSGPNTSQNMEWKNGLITQSASYSYILKPKREGTFTIGPATTDIDGTGIQSNSLTITVTGAKSSPEAYYRTIFGDKPNLHFGALKIIFWVFWGILIGIAISRLRGR